jgi:hypothetical protein
MNVIDSPPPESFAPDPTPGPIELAIAWTNKAKGWLIVYRYSRDQADLAMAKEALRTADLMSLKAVDGGAR